MTKEMRKVGGCNQQKNSVNCPCKDGDNMPRKERDYKAEYQKDKERRRASEKTVGVKLPIDIFDALDAKIALEPLTEDGKKITRNGLIRKWIDMYLAGQLD